MIDFILYWLLFYVVTALVLYFTLFRGVERDLRYDYEHDETDVVPPKHGAVIMSAAWLPVLFMAMRQKARGES